MLCMIKFFLLQSPSLFQMMILYLNSMHNLSGLRKHYLVCAQYKPILYIIGMILQPTSRLMWEIQKAMNEL